MAIIGGDPDRLVIYPSRAKALLVLLGSIAFVVIGIWIITGTSSPAPGWKVTIAAYVGVPFFGACGLVAIQRLVSRRPAIEIDATGITDSSSVLAIGQLTWQEIDYVVPYKYSGQAMLGIIPKDLDALLARQDPVRRFLIKLGVAMGSAPVSISQAMLSIKVHDLAQMLQTRYGVRVENDD